ncbi:MAG: tRNA1(Val) (adenine(37)-N6)-methyltransferase [Bosea sp. (in: a-proteobacteria)]
MTTASLPDELFGGRLKLNQRQRGHRTGTDAVLLVGAAGSAECVADLGSGVGPVGLGLLALGRAHRAVLVERDHESAVLARDNLVLNGFHDRATVVECDITAKAATLGAAGLAQASVDLVVCNPPFNTPGQHRASPDPARAAAHEMSHQDMDLWLKAAARILTGNGRLALIHRPQALPWLLAMIASRFGAIVLLPVHPTTDEAASRVLIGARLNSKAPARMVPALVLHESGGAFTSEAAALHSGEKQLALW